MSTASATRLAPQTGNNKLGLIAKILMSTVVIGLAVAFVARYVFLRNGCSALTSSHLGL
jgi:hypothetical protein